jgi:hypothetical protein
MSKIVLDLPVAVHIIIKSQLLALEDVAFGENSHPHTFADDPFRDVTVWVAGVIEKSSLAAPFGCVEVLPEPEFISP